jgi:hypothetical protein
MPTAAEMAAGGFTPADYETDPVDVWPENWPAWCTFCDVSSQWRTSATGQAVALDYTPLFLRMDRMRLDAEAWECRFADVRTLEAAALKAMAI